MHALKYRDADRKSTTSPDQLKNISSSDREAHGFIRRAEDDEARARHNIKKRRTGFGKALNRLATGKHVNEEQLEFSQELQNIFAQANLSEDFQEKAADIFNAAVHAAAARLSESWKQELEEKIEEAEDRIQEEQNQMLEELESRLDTYTSHVATEWLKENELSVNTGLKAVVAEEFMTGLRQLFESHNVSMPEGKTDALLNTLDENESLKESLNDAENARLELLEELNEIKRQGILAEATNDLPDTQAERLMELASSVEYTDERSYSRKIANLRESLFPANASNNTSSANLSEEVIETPASLKDGKKDVKSDDPVINAVADALSKSAKK